MWSPCLPTRGAANPTQASQPCGFYRVVAVRRAGAHCPVFLLGATTTTRPGQGCDGGREGSFLPPALPRLPVPHSLILPLRLSVRSHPSPSSGGQCHGYMFSSNTRLYGAPSVAWARAGTQPWCLHLPEQGCFPGGQVPSAAWTGNLWDQGLQGWGKAGPISLSRGCGRCPTQESKHQLWERPVHQGLPWTLPGRGARSLQAFPLKALPPQPGWALPPKCGTQRSSSGRQLLAYGCPN